MDNFPQFYKLLDSIMTKKDAGFLADDSNFNLYLMNRYVSFIHPMICRMINDTTNVMGFVQDPEDCEECFNVLYAIVPKMPWMKVDYVSKPGSKAQSENEISEEEMQYLCGHYELGSREIRDLLATAKN